MDSFLGEVRILPYTFAPKDWSFCNGQLVHIVQNQALFSIIGNYYGGDGRTTMALPNFKDRTAMGTGTGPGLTPRVISQYGGLSGVELEQSELPIHNHIIDKVFTDASSDTAPAERFLGRMTANLVYRSSPNGIDSSVVMAMETLQASGAGYAHENRQPSIAVNYCICIDGVYPSRN